MMKSFIPKGVAGMVQSHQKSLWLIMIKSFIPRALRRKKVLLFLPLFCLITADILISKISKLSATSVVDALVYESGSDDVDGWTSASIKTHVAIIRSDNRELSTPKNITDNTLTTAQIKEMVHLAISKDKYYGQNIPELKYIINFHLKGANTWVSIKANMVSYPGNVHTCGDQTDPRVIWAVLDYIADSTIAKRISLLYCGSSPMSDEMGFFTASDFSGYRWNTYFKDLPANFTIKSMVDAAQARHPDKTIECINLNYNEILQGGRPYNELTVAERVGKMPEIYPVPADPRIIGGLPTSNLLADGGYNPTDAILNCDILVNVPILKTAGLSTKLTCVMKNYIGSVSRAVYTSNAAYPQGRNGSLMLLDHDALVNTVVNLFSYHPSNYHVIDAIATLEGEGTHPWSERSGFLRRNLVIAGNDPVAVEAVCCALVNINPLDVETLRWGSAKGWGCLELDRIAILGDSLSSTRMDIKGPANHSSKIFAGFQTMHYYGRGCRRWLLNGHYTASDINTDHIQEAAADPYEGDIVNEKRWTSYYSPTDYVDLAAAVPGTNSNSVVYAFSRIYSSNAQVGKIYAGGVRDIQVFINGIKLVDTTGILSYSRVNVVKNLSLNQGDNRILVKVRRSGAALGFSIAIVNDGTISDRIGFYAHTSGGMSVNSSPTIFTAEMKQSFLGGRTLFNTFYHLGHNDDSYVLYPGTSHSGELRFSNIGPNPFRTATRIGFEIPSGLSRTQMDIFNAKGQRIRQLFSSRPANPTFVIWDAADQSGNKVSPGIYILRLTADNLVRTRSVVYLR